MSPTDERRIRQAVVIVHGMGEQRPLDALNGFIQAALPPDEHGRPRSYVSRPDRVTESYESRRYLVPPFAYTAPESPHGQAPEKIPQTEVYEYHWAHLMQGNRLDDMATTFRRMMLQGPWTVPSGLKVVWVLFWALILLTVWAFWRGPLADINLADVTLETLVSSLVGGGVAAIVLTYVVARLLPSWITTSFVDVARYLDTSPRSYEVRRLIRKGMVDLLQNLHRSNRYQRIVVVAHSLGAYIAYDGIAFLWTRMNKLHDGDGKGTEGGSSPAGLGEVEKAADSLRTKPTPDGLARYRRAQRDLWTGLRLAGNPWQITDFVSVGTPMYFAHRLYTKNRGEFQGRVDRRELPVCPPLPDLNQEGKPDPTGRYSWNNHGRRVIHEGGPFAVVRWTNIWFPTALGFFGDWFGGPLGPLFGRGIRDVKLRRNRPWRWTPGYAHSLYFKARKDHRAQSSAGELHRAMDLSGTSEATDQVSSDWVGPTLDAPEPDPRTAGTTAGEGLLPPVRQPPMKQLEELWDWFATRARGV